MLTLADIQTARFQSATGYCPSSPDFLELVNDAVTELIRRGDWSETLLPIRVCVKSGCVTWPRYVGQVRKMNACKGSIPMRSVWYEFLEHRRRGQIHEWQAWQGAERSAEMQFRAPTYNDIYGPNCTVRAYLDVPADIGATVTLFGTDNNGQPLTTNNGDGTWSPGVTLTGALPFASTNLFVSSIERVVKSPTQGQVRLYAYDATRDALWDLAVYAPSETNPSYLRYRLAGGERPGNGAPCNSGCSQTIIALVKLNPVPVQSPTDLVIINNRGALLDALRALKREDANDEAGARLLWAGAVEKLNRQLENDFPDEQFAARNNVFAGRTLRNRMF